MQLKDFVLIAIGVVCVADFAWSLMMTCASPTIAHAANWLSTVAFALLGPMWASQTAGVATRSRMIAGFSRRLSIMRLNLWAEAVQPEKFAELVKSYDGPDAFIAVP